METIILILAYLIPLTVSRYLISKLELSDILLMLYCFVPIFNIIVVFYFLIGHIDRKYDLQNIADWFFGIKKD